jgi:hypothetical protein
MDGYPYPTRPYPDSNSGPMMMNMTGHGMNGFDMVEGQSLDSIVAQNDKERRRLSMPVYARRQQQQQQMGMGMGMGMGSPEARRLSMVNFGDPNGGSMDDFQFDMSTAAMDNIMRSNTGFPRTAGDLQNTQLPAADLAINTQFQGQSSPFPAMSAPGSAYASPMHQKGPLDMDMASFQNGMAMPMGMDDSLSMMPTDMNMFPGSQFNGRMLDSPINQDFVGPMPAATSDNSNNNNNNNSSSSNTPTMQSQDQFARPSLSNTPEVKSGRSSFLSRSESQDHSSMRSNSRHQSEQHSSTSIPTRMSLAPMTNQQPIRQDPAQDLPKEVLNKQLQEVNKPSWAPPPGGFPSTRHDNPHMKTQFKNAYSSTGFDMIAVLVSSSGVVRWNREADVELDANSSKT